MHSGMPKKIVKSGVSQMILHSLDVLNLGFHEFSCFFLDLLKMVILILGSAFQCFPPPSVKAGPQSLSSATTLSLGAGAGEKLNMSCRGPRPEAIHERDTS